MVLVADFLRCSLSCQYILVYRIDYCQMYFRFLDLGSSPDGLFNISVGISIM